MKSFVLTHLCFLYPVLCCCDTRKATIIFAFLAAIGEVLDLVFSLLPSKFYTTNDIAPPLTTWYTITAYGVGLFFNLAAIWGAIHYHRLAVSIVVFWQVIFLALVIAACAMTPWSTTADKGSLIGQFIFQIAWQLLIIYSMGSFVSEVSTGIMSKETHSREKCKWNWFFLLTFLDCKNITCPNEFIVNTLLLDSCCCNV